MGGLAGGTVGGLAGGIVAGLAGGLGALVGLEALLVLRLPGTPGIGTCLARPVSKFEVFSAWHVTAQRYLKRKYYGKWGDLY